VCHERILARRGCRATHHEPGHRADSGDIADEFTDELAYDIGDPGSHDSPGAQQ
jgi:hypothetical protein